MPIGNLLYKYLPQGQISVHTLDASGSSLMARIVAWENPLICWNTVLILARGKGFLHILLFTSWKSDNIHFGKAHSDNCCHSNTPRSHRYFISILRIFKRTFGTGKALLWYDLTPFFTCKETSLIFQWLKVSLNKGSKFVSAFCNILVFSLELRWLHLLLTIAWRSSTFL